jgi:hypothetical protein
MEHKNILFHVNINLRIICIYMTIATSQVITGSTDHLMFEVQKFELCVYEDITIRKIFHIFIAFSVPRFL